MITEVRMSKCNGKTYIEVKTSPSPSEYPSPDLSDVGREFNELNRAGLYCYGLKVIVKLIKHFGYDYNKWYELLLGMSDYTLIRESEGIVGRFSKYWGAIGDYSPEEILTPIFIPHKDIKNFYPCDHCGRQNWLYGMYEEEDFCLNLKNCGYVRDHYRYNRPDKNKYSVGKYKEYYDMYMETDISLLRVIYDTFKIAEPGDLISFFDDNNRTIIIADMIKVCRSLGVEPPDLSGIPEEGYGDKYHIRSFDSIGLIENK